MPYSDFSLRAQSPFDFVDFGDVVPHNELVVNEELPDPTIWPVEFDAEEAMWLLKVPTLQRRDQKPLYYLDDENFLDVQPFEDLIISDLTSHLTDEKVVEPPEKKDILTATMDLLKLNKERLRTDFDTIDPKNNSSLCSSSAPSELAFLEGAKMLTRLSLLNEKEKLRKKLVSKYSNKRRSLLKNSFIKQRILANVHIENERKKKALMDSEVKKTSLRLKKDSGISVLNGCSGCTTKKRKLIEASSLSSNHHSWKCPNSVHLEPHEAYKKPRILRKTLIAAY